MTTKIFDNDADRRSPGDAPGAEDKPVSTTTNLDAIDPDRPRRILRFGPGVAPTGHGTRHNRDAAVSRFDADLLRSVGIDPGDIEDLLNGRTQSALFHPLRPRIGKVR
jgi:hypothetical protein